MRQKFNKMILEEFSKNPTIENAYKIDLIPCEDYGEIIAKIEMKVNLHPELRFIQILWILGLAIHMESESKGDRFNEEPEITYHKLVD